MNRFERCENIFAAWAASAVASGLYIWTDPIKGQPGLIVALVLLGSTTGLAIWHEVARRRAATKEPE